MFVCFGGGQRKGEENDFSYRHVKFEVATAYSDGDIQEGFGDAELERQKDWGEGCCIDLRTHGSR